MNIYEKCPILESEKFIIRLFKDEDDYWRQGYAFESCKAVIDYAFNSMNIHKIFAEAIDGIKSVNLMKKLGMKQEGIQRSQTKDNFGNWVDLYFYGILAEDTKAVSSGSRETRLR